jgi:alcohol dehydrogenase
MQAVVREEYQEPLEIHDVDQPEPESHGIVVRVVGLEVTGH